MENTYELMPLNSSQKSFYGKARVSESWDGSKFLYSYGTLVCVLNHDKTILHIEYYSQTTARHINEFLQQNGMDKMTKKEIVELSEIVLPLSLLG